MDEVMEKGVSANRVVLSVLTVLILIPLVFIAADSVLMTAGIPDPPTEATAFTADMPWVHLVSSAAVIFLLILFQKRLRNLPEKYLLIVGMILVFIVGLAWVFKMRVEAGADQLLVLEGASQFMQGNYEWFVRGGYFYVYPHQLGLAAYFQLFIAFAGQNAYLWIQAANVLWLMLGFYCLYKITALLFGKREITNVALVLLLFCFEILLYVVFVYGNLPAFGLGLLAVLLTLRYFKERKACYAVWSAVVITASILLRNNNLVWLVAMVIFYLLDAAFEKKKWSFAFAALLIGANLLGGFAVSFCYAQATGIPAAEGVPKTAWVAMGLQEGPMAPGWYNGYSNNLYQSMDYDGEKTAVQAKENIRECVANFAEHPGYAARFFYQKISSTWNNPTFQGFWISQVRDSQIEQDKLSNSIYNGGANLLLQGFMNLYQSVIYIGSALFFLFHFKKIRREQLLPGVIFLGTFLFHIFWETKAQYVATCFPLLIPYAACGWTGLSGRMKAWIDGKRKNKIHPVIPQEIP